MNQQSRTKQTSSLLKPFIRSVVTAVTVMSLSSACLSEEEKEARRAWAYDLSGEYDEAREDAVVAGSVVIENETSKNDIAVTFTRGALYAGEQAYVDLVVDEEERAALVAELILGQGESPVQEDLTGGENISDNFGESSKFSVRSEELDATAKLEGATDAKVHYTMSAEIVNLSDELRGTLTIHYQDRRPKADAEGESETELHTEQETFDVLLKRVAGPIEGEVCDNCTTGGSSDADDAAAEEPVDEGDGASNA